MGGATRGATRQTAYDAQGPTEHGVMIVTGVGGFSDARVRAWEGEQKSPAELQRKGHLNVENGISGEMRGYQDRPIRVPSRSARFMWEESSCAQAISDRKGSAVPGVGTGSYRPKRKEVREGRSLEEVCVTEMMRRRLAWDRNGAGDD